jgi:hypothetical protein
MQPGHRPTRKSKAERWSLSATASDALDNLPSIYPIWDRATIGSQNNTPED